MRQYKDDEHFGTNVINEFDEGDVFGLAEKDDAIREVSLRNSEMVHGYNFYCHEKSNDESGHFTENGFDDRNGNFSKEEDNDNIEHFLEGGLDNDDGKSDEDGWSGNASTQADY